MRRGGPRARVLAAGALLAGLLGAASWGAGGGGGHPVALASADPPGTITIPAGVDNLSAALLGEDLGGALSGAVSYGLGGVIAGLVE